MNRREFLVGLVAGTAIAACPAAIEAAVTAAPEVDFKVYYEQWMKDALDVFAECWSDTIIYGTSAYEHTNTYPFVRRIDPSQLLAPPTRGGLFG